MARPPKKKVILIPKGERFTLIGFGALFAAVGVVILSSLGVAIHGYLRTADLVSAEARILKIDRGRGKVLSISADYSYDYDGTTYRSSNVALFRNRTPIYEALRSAHDSGRTHRVWIDPASPSYAVIDREWDGSKFLFILPFIVVFGGFGSYLIFLGCRGTR